MKLTFTGLSLSVAALATGLATAARADQVIADDLIVSDGSPTLLCLGADCADGEVYDTTFNATLRLKAQNNLIEFDDTSTNTSFPDRDWKIQANAIGGGDAGEMFIIGDVTAGTEPFRIEGGAPTSAMWIHSNGNVGLGTTLPAKDLHLTGVVEAGIRFEDTGVSPYAWDLSGNSSGFYLYDPQAPGIPFEVRAGAPAGAFYAASDGSIGLGTRSPEGQFHLKSNGVQINFFESGDGGPVQVRFRSDSENRRFLATNNADEVKSQIIFKDNEILFTGQTDHGENLWLTIGPSGILSRGPTCSGAPCDRTFDTSYFTVPPIAERAAYMWENMHLPAVGPTTPGEQINLTEKTGGIIHELEVAHIYIEQLNERLEAEKAERASLQEKVQRLEAQQDQFTDLLARIERLERTE